MKNFSSISCRKVYANNKQFSFAKELDAAIVKELHKTLGNELDQLTLTSNLLICRSVVPSPTLEGLLIYPFGLEARDFHEI
ncbi:hypothetical protein TNCV_752951 [Trichonephila clavipes]|uniref:Uncharacterized protein n=1 Tax=Trichonephila clavipes TaxID=2585209 RepID=A0A8X7BI86_TRICX|nr:hypothetical protein TNCV_752951 [Trichonephila clavipes]